MPELIHEERALAESMGVTRETVRQMRVDLKEGKDWGKVGGRILLSAAAVETLAERLAGAQASPHELLQVFRSAREASAAFSPKKPSLPLESEPTTTAAVLWRPGNRIMVVDTRSRRNVNRKVVLGRPKEPLPAPYVDNKGLVRVRVRDNAKFVHGMEMTCRHVQSDLWELVGRGPRYRGRW